MSLRWLVRGPLLLGVLALPLLGVAVPATAQAPGQDSVTANGPTTFGCATIQITAQSGPSGEAPSGQVTCGSFFSGPVTCLNVQGNVALLTTQTPQFGAVAIRVIDNGPAGSDSVEAIPGSGCPTPQPSYVNFGFSGDAVVTDVQPPPPLPTTKEQCKKGGYATFGFRNQGQCIAFVNTGHRPPA
jgi:hypothetical protein